MEEVHRYVHCMLIFVVFIFVLSIKCRAMGQSRKLT